MRRSGGAVGDAGERGGAATQRLGTGWPRRRLLAARGVGVGAVAPSHAPGRRPGPRAPPGPPRNAPERGLALSPSSAPFPRPGPTGHPPDPRGPEARSRPRAHACRPHAGLPPPARPGRRSPKVRRVCVPLTRPRSRTRPSALPCALSDPLGTRPL